MHGIDEHIATMNHCILTLSLICDQMTRVISSPSSSTTGFCTTILAVLVETMNHHNATTKHQRSVLLLPTIHHPRHALARRAGAVANAADRKVLASIFVRCSMVEKLGVVELRLPNATE